MKPHGEVDPEGNCDHVLDPGGLLALDRSLRLGTSDEALPPAVGGWFDLLTS